MSDSEKKIDIMECLYRFEALEADCKKVADTMGVMLTEMRLILIKIQDLKKREGI